MAGDWIKMRVNLWDDPRVGSLVDATNSKEATIIGGLYWLWASADQHTETGLMPGLSLKQIDRKTGIKGFAQALCDIGWIEEHADGVIIAHFEEHNGASAKKRAQTAKRVANHKSGNAEVTPEPGNANADSVSSALPREEKRREEKRISVTEFSGNDDGSTPNQDSPVVVADWTPTDEILIAIETSHAIPVEFSLSIADEFRDFWTGKGELLPTEWQSRFRQRVTDQWDRKNKLRSVS